MILTQEKQETQIHNPVDTRPRRERRPEIIKQRKLIDKVRRKLGISKVQYEASDPNITSYATAKEVIDFFKGNEFLKPYLPILYNLIRERVPIVRNFFLN